MEDTPQVRTGELRVVEDVPGAFVELVEHQVRDFFDRAGSDNARFRLVLSGGATARLCYERLARSQKIDWARVECLLGDERCVPAGDPDANQKMIREALLEKLDPSPAFVPMDCDHPEAYEEVIASSPALDLVHLGLGPDGHTASLFPGSAALSAPPERLVVRNVDPEGHNLHPRLTLSLSGIARARLVVFTVAGAEKHEALRRVESGEDLPAAQVRAGQIVWLCDKAARVGSNSGG